MCETKNKECVRIRKWNIRWLQRNRETSKMKDRRKVHVNIVRVTPDPEL